MTPRQSHSWTDQESGSSVNDEPEFLAVGLLRKPHGVRGEMVMSVWTDFPERLQPGAILFVGKDHQPVTVQSVRWHRDDLLIKFEDYHTREDVGQFRNHVLDVRKQDLPPLEEGELYFHQLIGMNVFNEDGVLMGVIVEIIETGANDVFLVRRDDGVEVLVPDIDPVVQRIDVEKNEIHIQSMPGLFPDS